MTDEGDALVPTRDQGKALDHAAAIRKKELDAAKAESAVRQATVEGVFEVLAESLRLGREIVGLKRDREATEKARVTLLAAEEKTRQLGLEIEKIRAAEATVAARLALAAPAVRAALSLLEELQPFVLEDLRRDGPTARLAAYERQFDRVVELLRTLKA